MTDNQTCKEYNPKDDYKQNKYKTKKLKIWNREAEKERLLDMNLVQHNKWIPMMDC